MPAMSKAGRTDPIREEDGYTYPAMLILLVALGLALQAASIPTASRLIREREAELLYEDPMSDGDWLLVQDPGGGITGVVSRSDRRPRRRAFFPKGLENLEGAQSYADWRFVFAPEGS